MKFKGRLILQFHWSSMTSSIFSLVHYLDNQKLKTCITWARDPTRFRSLLWEKEFYLLRAAVTSEESSGSWGMKKYWCDKKEGKRI